MLWREWIPVEFYRYICQEENFKYLNGRDSTQPGVLEIVEKFINQQKENLRMLQKSLANYKDIFQYVYSHLFPEIYSTSEKRGIDLKSNCHTLFKTYRYKMKFRQQQLAKQPINYFNEQREVHDFEQKPFKNFDELVMKKNANLKKKQLNDKRLKTNRRKLLKIKKSK